MPDTDWEEDSAARMVRCARHPDTETNVRCSKCGVPICPRCMVQTPVGARCPDCALLKRVPTYDVGASHLARALAVGVAVAAAVGAAWAFIPFFSYFMALIAGYAVGEAISRAANRKRGRALQVVAGLSVLLAFVFSRMFPVMARVAEASGPGGVSAGFVARLFDSALAGLFNPLGLLVIAIGIFIAVRQVG